MMRVLLADDEKWKLKALVDSVREVLPQAELDIFSDGSDAWKVAQNKEYDLAITDISMYEMNGPELATLIHKKYPKTGILFQTGEMEWSIREMGIQPERCIFTPVTAEKVKKKLEIIDTFAPFEICPPEPEIEPEPDNEPGLEENITGKKKPGLFARMFFKGKGRNVDE